ncbi:carbonic anhydrase 14 [Eptesicus fuscus]|uniref:carbonic anhydrase 14 n=1 Tax=Eptesicus fuscus TaxID=29078 RepID=UPI002403DDFE|nr:carbonic anhydrase 14 [Eptesicus fuscus]
MFFTLLLQVIWILAALGDEHWTYEGPHGQDHWPASFPECGGNAQSPVNIQTSSVTFDSKLPALRPHGYDQPGTKPLELHNNGHTVQLSLPPTLYLEGLPGKYVAVQLHLHWGQKGSLMGSEHQINSKATAAELHVVHYDSDSYNSFSEAAKSPEGLAVLGILIEEGETENPAYEHILSHLHEIRYKGQMTAVPPFSVKELLPPVLAQYFRYNGSLTTPPCHQSVLWTVFSQKVQISKGQLEKLQETLFSTEKEPSQLLVQNYRVLQPLNQRTVLASFNQDESSYTTGEMLSLGVGILIGSACLLLVVYFIAKRIQKKKLRNEKSVGFTSAQATME